MKQPFPAASQKSSENVSGAKGLRQSAPSVGEEVEDWSSAVVSGPVLMCTISVKVYCGQMTGHCLTIRTL